MPHKTDGGGASTEGTAADTQNCQTGDVHTAASWYGCLDCVGMVEMGRWAPDNQSCCTQSPAGDRVIRRRRCHRRVDQSGGLQPSS
ncbi:unnamed protein product [Protopolystoma xenopodis]|uniref:Uncharacterized protein n=1 Tax=Protopolystoma xenopodis TaxID=117903 RepID=A0A448WNC2_9PLAT|nr:unnamed protein product [Protopolystoma xenopodis]